VRAVKFRRSAEQRADVPNGMVASIVLCLLVIFVPVLSRAPTLPDALPHLVHSESAVLTWHARAPRARARPYLDERFDTLGRIAADRQSHAVGVAQREFASILVDAAGDDRNERNAIREYHLHRFLDRLDGLQPDGLVRIASRHRLVGERAFPGVDRAMLIAWFELRWEAMAARESLRGETAPLNQLLTLLPAPDRAAALAWALYVPCDALLGTSVHDAREAPALFRCAAARRSFIDLGSAIDPSYPTQEALAATDVLLGRGLERLALRANDPVIQSEISSQARDAFERSTALYTRLATERPSAQRLRFFRGAAERL
jgi:hypothetical protein